MGASVAERGGGLGVGRGMRSPVQTKCIVKQQAWDRVLQNGLWVRDLQPLKIDHFHSPQTTLLEEECQALLFPVKQVNGMCLILFAHSFLASI